MRHMVGECPRGLPNWPIPYLARLQKRKLSFFSNTMTIARVWDEEATRCFDWEAGRWFDWEAARASPTVQIGRLLVTYTSGLIVLAAGQLEASSKITYQ